MVDPLVTEERRLRMLLVEDDFLIATDLALSLEAAGVDVVGPVGTVEDGLDLLAREAPDLDGAILDINLNNERVYPIADALIGRRVPFIFVTGYDNIEVPATYRDVPRFEKPVNHEILLRELINILKQPEAGRGLADHRPRLHS